jgi:hypothetical protein
MIPPPGAVEAHGRGYPQPSGSGADATAWRGGGSRSWLWPSPTDQRSNLKPWAEQGWSKSYQRDPPRPEAVALGKTVADDSGQRDAPRREAVASISSTAQVEKFRPYPGAVPGENGRAKNFPPVWLSSALMIPPPGAVEAHGCGYPQPSGSGADATAWRGGGSRSWLWPSPTDQRSNLKPWAEQGWSKSYQRDPPRPEAVASGKTVADDSGQRDAPRREAVASISSTAQVEKFCNFSAA